MTKEYDRRSNERQIEKLQREICLRDAILDHGLRETLLALVDEYGSVNVEEFTRKILSGAMK